MTAYQSQLHKYTDSFPIEMQNRLPDSLRLNSISVEGVLIRLLLGNIKIYGPNNRYFSHGMDFTVLPLSNCTLDSFSSIERVFSLQLANPDHVATLNKYLMNNRRNTDIHNQLLCEITKCFILEHTSPTSSFIHLYRCLEFMSYSFPLIYASKSTDYAGTYKTLKSFLTGDPEELKFFRIFVKELFRNEPTTLSYEYEIELSSSNLQSLIRECSVVLRGLSCQFDGDILKIRFEDMHSFIVTIRNRYVHMKIGDGQKNLRSLDYDIDDLFRSINRHVINWLSVIFCAIAQHGYEHTL